MLERIEIKQGTCPWATLRCKQCALLYVRASPMFVNVPEVYCIVSWLWHYAIHQTQSFVWGQFLENLHQDLSKSYLIMMPEDDVKLGTFSCFIPAGGTRCFGIYCSRMIFGLHEDQINNVPLSNTKWMQQGHGMMSQIPTEKCNEKRWEKCLSLISDGEGKFLGSVMARWLANLIIWSRLSFGLRLLCNSLSACQFLWHGLIK